MTSRGYPSHVIANDGDPTSRFNDAIQVVAAEHHSCALKEDGTIYCWGREFYLGINSTSNIATKNYPVPVTITASNNLSGITQISSHHEHTCAVNSSGNVYCWGDGQFGRIGNGFDAFVARATLVVEGDGSITALTGISKVSVGGESTCTLKTDGGVLCWGRNNYGQLGNGNIGEAHNTNYPVSVIDSTGTAISGVIEISLGFSHACALTNVGKVLCWGYGGYGRLGSGEANSKKHPVYVVEGDNSSAHLTGIVQISGGEDFTCALNNLHNVYCWGQGENGRLGNDFSNSKRYPVHVVETDGNPSSMLSDVAQVEAGLHHSCVLKITGKIFCWGEGKSGSLGDNDIAVHAVDHPVSVVTSSSDATPLTLGGVVICKNDGNGDKTCNPLPPLPTFITGQLEEDDSDSISLDLDTSETPSSYSFYSDQYCNLNLTHTSNANPVTISNLPSGRTHIYFERGARSLCYDSELIYNRTTSSSHTRQKIAAGGAHTCALTAEEEVICWGKGSYGRLGNNATGDKDHQVPVKSVDGTSTLDDILEISAGGSTTCALESNGKVLCWGYGASGRLGNDNSDNENKLPIYVVDGDGSSTHLTGIVQITTGGGHSCALKTDGGVLCWGINQFGQLGNNVSGTSNNKDHPVAVKSVDGASNLGGITYIVAGTEFTCALSYRKKVYCWGFNYYGQLGNNTTTDSSLPVLVVDGDSSTNGLSEITQIATGDGQTCALNSNGNAYCWGSGTSGELGNGATGSKNYPVLVVDGQSSTTALAGIVQVGAGDSFSCALKSDGGVHCFGAESYGKLGNNETASGKNYPVPVLDSAGVTASAISGISKIALGSNHACALKDDGEMLCWGDGRNGRLGDDATSNSLHAVTVVAGDNQTDPLELDTPIFSSYTCNSSATSTTCATD